MAHEVRNPIATLRLGAENVLAGDAARHRPALEASLGQIDRVDRLLAELLAMMQRRPPERREVDLRQFLDGVAREHRDRTEAGSVSLTVDYPVLTACLDPELIRRALDNLLLNAIRHTPPGGRVQVRAAIEAARVRMTVTGTGPVWIRRSVPGCSSVRDRTAPGLASPLPGTWPKLMTDLFTWPSRAGPGGAAFVLELPHFHAHRPGRRR